MSEPSTRRMIEVTGAGAAGAGLLMLLQQAGTFEFDWDWSRALACLLAGTALLSVSRAGTVLYAGVVERLAGRDPRLAWTLRALVLLTAPLAGAGAVLYSFIGMVEVVRSRNPSDVPLDWRRTTATGLIGMGVILAAQAAGMALGSVELLWSVVLIAPGLVLFWVAAGRPSNGTDRGVDDDRIEGLNDRQLLTGVGLLLTFSGASLVLDSTGLFDQAGGVIVGAAIAGAVLALVVGPRWLRTLRQLRAERIARARATERSELAAHLHDSVLQTLALIQRRAHDPAEVGTLARRQERELREWLSAPTWGAAGPSQSVATALRAAAAEVEDHHRVKIEVVTVGDAPLSERAEAFVSSAREAMVNAAVHGGGASISLYAEVDSERVTGFVRDRGPGFDHDAVPEDRRGIRESIVGRMARGGGSATVRSSPGAGTEVELDMRLHR